MTKVKRYLPTILCVLVIAMTIATQIMPAFASSDVWNTVNTKANDIYNKLSVTGLIIAALAFAANIIVGFLHLSPQYIEKTKSTCLWLIIGGILLLISPQIFVWIKNTFGGGDTLSNLVR